MPGTNFLQFNPTQANQETDAQYLVDALRTGGYSLDAIVPSVLLNKATFQASTWIAAMGQMMANKGFTVSDANLATLTAVLTSIITTVDLVPYALLASPTFSGTPSAPAPSGGAGDNSTHIANTAWVQSFFATITFVNATFASIGYVNSTFAPINSPAFSGAPTTPAPSGGAGDNSGHIVNTAWIQAFFASLSYVNTTFAPIASPTFSGTPSAPTPTTGNRSTRLATTAMFANEFPVGLAGNGWAQLASGFIMQWGITGPLPSGATTQVFFPRTFPSTCASVTASYTNSSVGDATLGNPLNVCLAAPASFSIFNGGSADSQYFWHAFGF